MGWCGSWVVPGATGEAVKGLTGGNGGSPILRVVKLPQAVLPWEIHSSPDGSVFSHIPRPNPDFRQMMIRVNNPPSAANWDRSIKRQHKSGTSLHLPTNSNDICIYIMNEGKVFNCYSETTGSQGPRG